MVTPGAVPSFVETGAHTPVTFPLSVGQACESFSFCVSGRGFILLSFLKSSFAGCRARRGLPAPGPRRHPSAFGLPRAWHDGRVAFAPWSAARSLAAFQALSVSLVLGNSIKVRLVVSVCSSCFLSSGVTELLGCVSLHFSLNSENSSTVFSQIAVLPLHHSAGSPERGE